ncbi:hypothetical protein V6N13_086317 [Hibiscus sabdariffa]
MKRPFNSIAASSKTHFEESEEDEEMEFSSEEEESIDSDEEEEIERELAEVTFEELQKARADGTDSVSRKPRSDAKHRRANKNRPMELSSKKPVRSFRQVIQTPKKASCKLESFIEKKRRKNAAKDHRFMPYRRPNNGEQHC